MTTQQQNSLDPDRSRNTFFNKNFWIKLSFIGVSALLWFLTKLSIGGYSDNMRYQVEVSTESPELVAGNYASFRRICNCKSRRKRLRFAG